MANPILPGLTGTAQEALYNKLNAFNEGRPSYKETGAYLVVLPRPGHTRYSLWIYSPLPERQSIFYLCELAADAEESLRMASAWCYYSSRRLFIVEYNAKRMQSKGDDLVSFGKYRGHFLHEVLSVDPAYVAWIAFKFTPRIPKQERFVQIAKIYHSVHLDFQQRRSRQGIQGNYLGNVGDRVEGLTLTVVRVRLEDDPYKTQVQGTTPYFYVRQVLWLKDAAGNSVTFRIASRTASRKSGVLPALEHAFAPGEVIRVASARINRTYTAQNVRWTRLTYVRLEHSAKNETNQRGTGL